MAERDDDMKDTDLDLIRARAELASVRGDSDRVEQLHKRLKHYIESNAFAEKFVSEILRAYR